MEGDAAGDGLAGAGQQAVVESLAVAEPGAVVAEAEAGDEDQTDPVRVPWGAPCGVGFAEAPLVGCELLWVIDLMDGEGGSIWCDSGEQDVSGSGFV